MKPEQFPVLRSVASDTQRFDTAVEQVFVGVAAGSIRNVTLQESKFTLSRTAEKAWEKTVCEPYFWGEKRRAQHEEDVRTLYDNITIIGLHDVISANKKVGKSKSTSAAVDAMRAFCAEALPLAEAVAALKDKVIKGRAPNAVPAKPENPNKVVKTCPVCFRAIAVPRATMAHHGYYRPHPGWQTASCPGIRFKPLEVSSEGLAWLVDTLREQLSRCVKTYDNRESLQGLIVHHGIRQGKPLVKVTRDDPAWPLEFRLYVDALKNEIGSLEYRIPILAQKLAEWKPEEQSNSRDGWEWAERASRARHEHTNTERD